tara:strand:+ start:213 stop:1088 length:876 start_codon:yes stop_codon:yes gene_type:complete
MGLFRKELREEISSLISKIRDESVKLPDNWEWFPKEKRVLANIEDLDKRILDDFRRLHKEAKDSNPGLAKDIEHIAKTIILNLTIMLKEIEKGKFRDTTTESKESLLLKKLIQQLHDLLDKELDPYEIFKRISVNQIWLSKHKYLEIYYKMNPDQKGKFASPVFFSPPNVYFLEGTFPLQFVKYPLLHEAWELRVYVLAYHEHPKYTEIPTIERHDDIHESIHRRAHEIATYEELLQAKRDGILDDYFMWFREELYRRPLKDADDIQKKEIILAYKIKYKIYLHVKKHHIK